MFNINGQPNKVSNFQLKLSYWYITHKLQLRKGLIILLIILSFIFYSYSVYKALMILVVEDKGFRQDLNYLSADLINYSYFRQINKPQNLQISGFSALPGREGRYDFVAKIKNPNPNFVARRVLIQLIAGSEVTAEKTAFLYPGEEKYVAIFGQEVTPNTKPVLKIASVNWWRVHKFEEFSLPRLKFEISEIEFKSARESGIRGELPVSTLNFKIKNNSAYSYWQVGISMVLLGAGQVAGANYLALDQFVSGETRDIEMRWYESLPAIVKVEILPEVDILNPDSYMPVE